jgi:PTS system fructose-specific IIA component
MTKSTTIDFNMQVATREAAVRHLGTLLLRAGRIDDLDLFVEDVLKREEIESTNMDIGVAIPHGISGSIKRNSIAIGRLAYPIAWRPGEDKQKVRVIFLMAVMTENRDRIHIELLSRIATLLVKEPFLEVLFKTSNKQELLDTVHKFLEE